MFSLSVTDSHAGHLPLQSHIEEEASSEPRIACFDYRPDDRMLPDKSQRYVAKGPQHGHFQLHRECPLLKGKAEVARTHVEVRL